MGVFEPEHDMCISIHALLAESDTLRVMSAACWKNISIHALLAESDGTILKLQCVLGDFYPRSPCGERPSRAVTTSAARYFYPRSPCGERPLKLCKFEIVIVISIHALLAESDHVRRPSG